MNHIYANRKRAENTVQKTENAATQPSMDALRSGAAKPTSEQMGHRVDLPDVMRAKMENAFGADLSAVKLYESQAVADAGAEAVTQGANIAFAPGMLDFTSYGGQALLGHEISHVVSQSRGEVNGDGFLNDSALEARADREGAMAASGQQIVMPTAAFSAVTAASAAGPMQAKKRPYQNRANLFNQDPKKATLRDKLDWKLEQMTTHRGRAGKMLGKVAQKGRDMLYPSSYEPENPTPLQQVMAAGGPSGSEELRRMSAMGPEEGEIARQVNAAGGLVGSEELRRMSAMGPEEAEIARQVNAAGGLVGTEEERRRAAWGY